MNHPIIPVKVPDLLDVLDELNKALEPMVTYKSDPLEFCNLAHQAANNHIRKAIHILTDQGFLTDQYPTRRELVGTVESLTDIITKAREENRLLYSEGSYVGRARTEALIILERCKGDPYE